MRDWNQTMPQIRMSIWCINRLASVYHELNPYQAPEQLQSSSQLEWVIQKLLDEHEDNRRRKQNTNA
jgi:hypothetical protein